LEYSLNKLDDGITAIAASTDGSLYLACWNSLLKVDMDGKVTTWIHPVVVGDCDEDPADHKEVNRGKPLLRGLAVDSGGTVYAAATSCHCLLKIEPNGKVKTILRSQRPWTPTGVAIRNGNIYVLEYTNANGPTTEGWIPRVRKIEKNGKIVIMADFTDVNQVPSS
jgi:sugar lactone lactonase YvrE